MIQAEKSIGFEELMRIELIIFNHSIGLIGDFRNEEKSIFFVLDVETHSSSFEAQHINQLSTDDINLLDKMKLDDGINQHLNEKLGKGKDWEVEIKVALKRVHIKNVALYWEFKTKRAVLYLDISVDLENLAIFTLGDFALKSISMEMTVLTGKSKETNDLTDDDLKRRKEINKIRHLFKGNSKIQNSIHTIQKSINDLHDASKKMNSDSDSLKNRNQKLDNLNDLIHFTKKKHQLNELDQSHSDPIQNKAVLSVKMENIQSNYSNIDTKDKINEIDRIARSLGKEHDLTKILEEDQKRDVFIDNEVAEILKQLSPD